MSGVKKEDAPPGIFLDGFGVEVQGYNHKKVLDTAATVYLEPETKYRLRLANANDFMSMVSITVDDISIGTFLLNPFSKFDLERPLDRPLGFTFGSLPTPLPPNVSQLDREQMEKARRKQLLKDKTIVVATFKPEVGAKVVQVDVSATHIGKTHRMEILNDTPVYELFSRLHQELGDSIVDPKCALIHWTTAEYDSPVEDVMRQDMQMHMSNCKRRYDPIRKMSMIMLNSVTVDVICKKDTLSWTLDSSPTFGDVLRQVRNKIDGLETCDLYFLSENGRYISSTKWIKDHTYVLQLLHKDEVHPESGVLSLKVVSSPPEDCFVFYARMLSGPSYQLEAGSETTVRECRYQLEELGGPWGEDPRWMFGGTILESGRIVGSYAIAHRVSVDIIPKLFEQGKYCGLQMRDPIAIEGEEKINTAQLIKKAEQRAQKQARGKGQGGNHGKPRRGATVLKGRIQQQFIEVDPLEVDQRFFVGLSVTVLPKELENLDLRATTPSQESPDSNRSSCSVS